MTPAPVPRRSARWRSWGPRSEHVLHSGERIFQAPLRRMRAEETGKRQLPARTPHQAMATVLIGAVLLLRHAAAVGAVSLPGRQPLDHAGQPPRAGLHPAHVPPRAAPAARLLRPARERRGGAADRPVGPRGARVHGFLPGDLARRVHAARHPGHHHEPEPRARADYFHRGAGLRLGHLADDAAGSRPGSRSTTRCGTTSRAASSRRWPGSRPCSRTGPPSTSDGARRGERARVRHLHGAQPAAEPLRLRPGGDRHVSKAAALLLGGIKALQHQLTPGNVVLFLAYLDQVYSPIGSLTEL